MSIAIHSGPAHPVRQILQRIAASWAEARDRRKRKRAIGSTRAILNDLPDSILRDIGITRGQIHTLAAQVHGAPGDDSLPSWREKS